MWGEVEQLAAVGGIGVSKTVAYEDGTELYGQV